jgi:ElaB/YqjD/DUF883 family membrane-anchored ribosome-binding protein
MNATANDNDLIMTGNGKAAAGKARAAAQNRRDGGTQEVHDLMAHVQDLLGQMAHVADPEIARLRARVAEALEMAKRAVASGSQQVQRQTKDAMRAGDAYVRNQPWQAVGVAAVVGLIAGILVAKR